MAEVRFAENFYVLRKYYSAMPTSMRVRHQAEAPTGETEIEYQQMLEIANEEYFHREYAVALKSYFKLRNLILVQSNPELPISFSEIYIDNAKLNMDRFFELARKYFVERPHDPIPDASIDFRLEKGLFPVEPQFSTIAKLGVMGAKTQTQDLDNRLKQAKENFRSGDMTAGIKLFETTIKEAAKEDNDYLTARAYNELGASMMMFAAGRTRTQMIKKAISHFSAAAKIYDRLGDEPSKGLVTLNLAQAYAEAGDANKAKNARTTATKLIPAELNLRVSRGVISSFKNLKLEIDTPVRRTGTATKATYFAYDDGYWSNIKAVYDDIQKTFAAQNVGLYANDKVVNIRLAADSFKNDLISNVYKARKNTDMLAVLDFMETVKVNFVAYIPHLYFFVLPMAIGDTYAAMGCYSNAVTYYQSALAYPYLNDNIEARYVWIKMAQTYLKWGNEYFRQENTGDARSKFDQIIKNNASLSNASPLYKPAIFNSIKQDVQKIATELKGGASADVNPTIKHIVYQAYTQQAKLKNNLNYLGLSDDYYPVTRFRYLQNVARYMAEHAIQAERAYINFRSMAEQQKMDRMHLENTVALDKISAQIENKRLADASYEKLSAQKSREYMGLRKSHAEQQLHTWDTDGWELASVNAALSWASNAANDQDITYTGVYYNGQSHDFDTDVEEFYDVVGEWREYLSWSIQREKLAQQVQSAAMELQLAQLKEQQAEIRYQIQELSYQASIIKLQGSQELLSYTETRTFNEDTWFQMAGAMEDMARHYLDMAIYAAFLMERAYDLEFDRNLNRIRFDYQSLGVKGMLAADYLLYDIDYFTQDYLQNVQKKNHVRQVISLREEHPAAFNVFIEQGILPFTTELEYFDRKYPGSYRRKLKNIEIFVEGLVPTEGLSGFLQNGGVFWEWSTSGGSWNVRHRVIPSERQVLSSYQIRRDYTIFQPSEEVLGIFENLDVGGSWRFELPRSSNNIDYRAISDVKIVLYFDAEYSDGLAAHLKTVYGNTTQKMLALSSRFHFPDAFFKIEQTRSLAFALHRARFAYNITDMKINYIGIRLLSDDLAQVSGKNLTLHRLSDATERTVSTNENGLAATVPAAADPLDAFMNASPVDTFTVGLLDGIDTTQLNDVQLIIGYEFKYRPDGSI